MVFERAESSNLTVHLIDVTNAQASFIISSSSFVHTKISSFDFELNSLYLSVSESILVVPTRLEFNDASFNGAIIFNIKSSIVDFGHIIHRDPLAYSPENIEAILAFNGILYTKSRCQLLVQYGYNGGNPQFIDIPPTCDETAIRTRK